MLPGDCITERWNVWCASIPAIPAKNQLPYFLSGQQPPTIDPALDLIDEEDSDTELDLFE